MGSIATNEQEVETAITDIESWYDNYINLDALSDIGEVFVENLADYAGDTLQSVYEKSTDGFVDSVNWLFGEDSLESKSIGFSNTNTVDGTPTWVDSNLNDYGLSEPIDFHYFDTTSDALSPWESFSIFDYSSSGSISVYEPYTPFTSIDSLFDAEASLFHDSQYGTINLSEYRVFENFVLDYSLDNFIDNFESYTDSKPAGKRAFYTVITDEDNAPGVADKTGLLVNSNNQVVTAAQLQSLDSDGDGMLSGSELDNLKYWQNVNKQVYLKAA